MFKCEWYKIGIHFIFPKQIPNFSYPIYSIVTYFIQIWNATFIILNFHIFMILFPDSILSCWPVCFLSVHPALIIVALKYTLVMNRPKLSLGLLSQNCFSCAHTSTYLCVSTTVWAKLLPLFNPPSLMTQRVSIGTFCITESRCQHWYSDLEHPLVVAWVGTAVCPTWMRWELPLGMGDNAEGRAPACGASAKGGKEGRERGSVSKGLWTVAADQGASPWGEVRGLCWWRYKHLPRAVTEGLWARAWWPWPRAE